MYNHVDFKEKTHRLIPSRHPPVSLFDWVESAEELEQLAILEGLTNDRLNSEYGQFSFVAKEDWVGGMGSTPLMAAFTHFGPSRFSDGSNYGVYYAGDCVETAIAETKFHRERFLSASQEPPCAIQMREYIAHVVKPLVALCDQAYEEYCSPDLDKYPSCQRFGQKIKLEKEWGLLYPSARHHTGKCIAIFRPPALTIPVQAGHFDYIWDGESISEIRKTIRIFP